MPPKNSMAPKNPIDPKNPVVMLCADGMAAEFDGNPARARDLFHQAWDAATDNYESCIAAHYLARQQPTATTSLHWNQECLRLAELVNDDRVQSFFPSLHGAIARYQLILGNPTEAHHHFQLAATHLNSAPAGPYRDGLRYLIATGLRDSNPPGTDRADRTESAVRPLVDRLCETRDFTSLALVLPAYVGHLSSEEDQSTLIAALQQVHVSSRLTDDDQSLLRTAIDTIVDTATATTSETVA